MKILVLEREPSSERGGQELSLRDVCRGLSKRGHEIHLVYNKRGNLLEEYQAFSRSLTQVAHYTINRAAILGSSISWLASLCRAALPKVDLVYVNQYHDTFFGGALARMKSIPLVCHLRLLPPDHFCGQWKIGLKAVTKFIVVSDAAGLAYKRCGFDPSSMVRVYNGIDLKQFAPADDGKETRQSLGIPLNAFVLLFVGRMDHDKKLENAIEIFAKLNLHTDDGRLLMVGGPLNHPSREAGLAYVEELKSLCVAKGIEKQTLWLGRRNDLPRLFRAADATLLLDEVEAFGRVLVESMACGAPAIGIARGGIPEVLSGEFRRFCIEPENGAQFIDVLRSLEGWQQSDPTLGKRCRTFVEERFPIERMIDGVEMVLQKAVAIQGKC